MLYYVITNVHTFPLSVLHNLDMDKTWKSFSLSFSCLLVPLHWAAQGNTQPLYEETSMSRAPIAPCQPDNPVVILHYNISVF